MAVDWNSPVVIEAVRRGARKGVFIGITLVESRAVYLITQTGKHGKVYRRRGVSHQSSGPYQPFASDSGDTLKRRDISFQIEGKGMSARLTFRSINAARQEFGTKKMKPRPYARRALFETRREVPAAIISEIVAELRKL